MTQIPKITALFQTTLAAGITNTSTSFTLNSVLDMNGEAISGYYGFVIDEGNEEAEFFLVTISGSVATVVKRGLDPTAPETEVTALKNNHRRGAVVKATNYPILGLMRSLLNGEGGFRLPNLIGYTTGLTPVADGDFASKAWVETLGFGGSLSIDKIAVPGNAGETVADGELVYFNTTDDEWKLVDARETTHVNNTIMGVAQGAGTNGNSISGGVLLAGVVTGQSGTAGEIAYATDTPGVMSTTAGTLNRPIGRYKSATEIYFDPSVFLTPTQKEKEFLGGVTGAIFMYSSDTAPTGFLNCDGSAISRTTYADLFAVTGTTYGSGDGSTTFNLPDLRSSIPVGQGQKTVTFNFVSGDVNAGTDIITVPSNDFIQTGTPLVLTSTGEVPTLSGSNKGFSIDSGGTITGDIVNYVRGNGQRVGLTSNASVSLSTSTLYYVTNYVAGSSFTLSTTPGGATAGTGDPGGNSSMYSLGLVSGTTYYAIRQSATTIKLATSLANAIAGEAIELVSGGTGTHTFTLTLSSRAMGSSGGEESHGLTTAEIPSHTHTVAGVGSVGGYPDTASFVSGSVASSATGGSTAHNNMPPYIVLNYIIKT